MKMKSLVLLVMAIGCGFVAMLGVQQVLSGDKKPRVETSKVLIAVTNIMPGQPLDDTNVAFKDWPKAEIPEGAVTTHEQYQDRSLRVAAVPNEIVMSAKLNEKGVFGGSSEIPTGMRVATVPVNITKTHSGLIMPGDRVDVVVTYNMTTPGRGRDPEGEDHPAIHRGLRDRQHPAKRGSQRRIQGDERQEYFADRHAGPVQLVDARREQGQAVAGAAAPRRRRRGPSGRRGRNDVRRRADHSGTRRRKGRRGRRRRSKDKGKGHGKKVASKEKEKEVEVTEKPTWTLRIFEGDKLREEQVEVPQEAGEAAKNPEKPAKSWPAFLKNFFHRAT